MSKKLKDPKKRNPYKVLVVLLLIVALSSYAYATLISDTTSTFTGDVDLGSNSLNASKINNVYYVQAGNASDIQAKIDLASSGGEVILSCESTYTIDSTIQLDNNVLLVGCKRGSTIKPTGNFTVINMSSVMGTVRDLTIDTTGVLGYNESTILFDDDINYPSTWEHLRDLYIIGSNGATTGSSGIKFQDNNGGGITWVEIRNIYIKGFNYGILMNCSAANGYLNALQFNTVHFERSTYGLYMDTDDAGSCATDGNYVFMSSNGNADINNFAVIEGDRNYFHSIFFDPHLLANTNEAYIMGVNSSQNVVVDNVLNTIALITDNGVDNDFFLKRSTRIASETNYDWQVDNPQINGRLRINGTATDRQVDITVPTGQDFRLNFQEDLNTRWIIHRDNADATYGDEILAFENSSNSPILRLISTGGVVIGDGSSQQNITLTSPDGTEYSCGVNNGGSFTCV